jgi:quinol monooxygenase YgiN
VLVAVTYFVRMRAREGQADAVRALLLSNVERIRDGEQGNVVFAVHRSLDDANEFWLYETWTDVEAVEAHESGSSFHEYKDTLRPLVEPDSVVFGNTEPEAVLGYSLPEEK